MAPSFPLIFFLAVAAVITSISATEYEVGGLVVGWRIPAVNESELYTVWASRRRFYIGDTLRFRYKNDSVVVVEKWGLYHCDSSNPIAYYNDGDTVVSLDIPGTMYFISGDADRCKHGVNMIVEVKNPGPVRYIPPKISNPPESTYSAVAPSPVQLLSPGGLPELNPGPGAGPGPGPAPGPSSSGSIATVSGLVSVLVTVTFAVGLGLWV